MSLVEDPRTLTEIADTIKADPPYATVIVNELTACGLVLAQYDGSNRRRKLVELTVSSHVAAHQAKQIIDRPPRAIQDLERRQLTDLVDALRHVVDNTTGEQPDIARQSDAATAT